MSLSSDSATALASPVVRGRVLRAALHGSPTPAHVVANFDRDLGEPLPAVVAAAAEAYRDGYAAGMSAGSRQLADHQRADHLALEESARTVSAAVERAGAAVVEELRALDRDHATALLSIAVSLAEAVLGREVAASTRKACEAVERAMTAVLNDPGITPIAHLHPGDAALLASGDLPNGVTVVSDPSIASGDCVLRVADRSIDARLRTALERAGAVLLDVHAVEDVRL